MVVRVLLSSITGKEKKNYNSDKAVRTGQEKHKTQWELRTEKMRNYTL